MRQLQNRFKHLWSGLTGHRTAIALVIALLLIGAIAALTAAPASGPPEVEWSRDYVEQQWDSAQTPSFNLVYTRYGWDSTGRFYAAVPPDSKGTDLEGVTIIDRVKKRTCTLRVVGLFPTGRFHKGTYTVVSSTQHGWSGSTTLNLSTWEVTAVVSDSCSQWAICSPIDPAPELQGVCDPDNVYGP